MQEKINSIKIWKFYDAPIKYQKMSINGGDEDYIALIPPNYVEDLWKFPFLEEGTSFGCCCVDKFKLNNGYVVLIGSHA